MSDWNPELYMKFRSERTQPSIDLISRIDDINPKSILDVGCGPGNSTQVLANRWPEANISGIDNSESMIAKAAQDYPRQEWQVADAATYCPGKEFDLVFSNAVIQWIPNHANLLARFHNWVSEKGALAIQMPQFWDMPLGKIIRKTGDDARWKDRTGDVVNLFTIHDYVFYYDQLARLFPRIDIWQTDYMHVLENHEAIIEMMRSTGLKPYLDRLDSEADQKEFEERVLKGIKTAYPKQTNGKVILPFKRMFIVGYK